MQSSCGAVEGTGKAVGPLLLAVGNAVGGGGAGGVWECLWGRVGAGVLRGGVPPRQAIRLWGGGRGVGGLEGVGPLGPTMTSGRGARGGNRQVLPLWEEVVHRLLDPWEAGTCGWVHRVCGIPHQQNPVVMMHLVALHDLPCEGAPGPEIRVLLLRDERHSLGHVLKTRSTCGWGLWEVVGGCGRLWEVVGGCGRLWEVVGGCGRLWEVVEGCGRLWEVVGGCGRLWEVVGGCGRLWEVVGGCGRLWEVVGGCGRLWEVVGGCGRLWEVVEGGCGRLWEVVGGCVRLWEVVGGCGRLWEVVGGCGRLWEVVGGCGRLWEVVGGCGRLCEVVGGCGRL